MERSVLINSHNSWSQLEEVWLGDVYPSSWYDHLEPEIRDVFQQITEITKQDLAVIQAKLESFGITVRRPEYNNINDFVDSNGALIKPEICPRDTFLTVGNTLLTPRSIGPAWRSVLALYTGHTQSGATHIINGANVVRVGRDIIIDTDIFDIPPVNDSLFQNYRITWEKNGGHMDGCFAILKPGLIIANHYYDGYDRNFPGWECIFLNEPTYNQHIKYPPQGGEYNGKFYAEDISFNQAFNDHVIAHAQTWVGDYTETFFELNCLVINESNVMMLGYNEALEKELSSRGITVHWIPFRCRGFWDGGMHCITVDIRRRSSIVDYFPERS
jgi:N-dimethylarginine dimethylaminohydrolase